jgi:hypothetical protein
MKQYIRLINQIFPDLFFWKKRQIQIKTIAITAAFFLFMQMHANAQNSTLTGHVADSASKPLSGVTVSTDKSKKFATTDTTVIFLFRSLLLIKILCSLM